MLPDAVRAGVEGALEDHGVDRARIVRVGAVGGGCISPVARIETEGGDPFFLKQGSTELPADMLAAEARGLRRLAGVNAVRVPAVLGVGGEGATAWLLTEWLEPGPPREDSWSRLGGEVAALHRVRADRFGEDTDNYIGSLPQSNARASHWPSFWRTHRLEPQLRSALDSGRLGGADGRRFDDLFDRLDDLLAPADTDGVSLLHGDLWSGNVHMTSGGSAALIDPSPYDGHREVDVAMADLFGGFGAGFRAAYEAAWPLTPGYAPRRRAVYQLYYLLVHVNLFGQGYVGRTRAALTVATT